MISAIYAILAALLILWLSMNVIKIRRRHRISVGDGDNQELITAMAAQSNAVEYLPVALLLLFSAELNHAHPGIIHILGIALLTARLIHARGILTDRLAIRVLGMQITFYTIIGLVVTNLVYLPYAKLFFV